MLDEIHEVLGIGMGESMSKFQQLREEYNTLDAAYELAIARNMELEYKYKQLDAMYQREADQSEEIKRLHEKARRLKHDMKNHILVIAAYLNSNENDNAKDYLSQILNKLNQMYSYIETGNSILNYIINTKLEFANKNEIAIKAEVENLPFASLESVDLSALLSNLLDNAIEASLHVADPLIIVEIRKRRGYDTILIKNRIHTSILASNPELRTTKAEKLEHGIGISQIQELVLKYDGMLEFYEEEGMFHAYVCFLSE